MPLYFPLPFRHIIPNTGHFKIEHALSTSPTAEISFLSLPLYFYFYFVYFFIYLFFIFFMFLQLFSYNMDHYPELVFCCLITLKIACSVPFVALGFSLSFGDRLTCVFSFLLLFFLLMTLKLEKFLQGYSTRNCFPHSHLCNTHLFLLLFFI